MKEDNKTEWIDQYLDNELKELERIEFEHLLEQDPAFRLEVDAQKAVRRSLQEWGNEELKNKFKLFHARLKQQEDNPLQTIVQPDHPVMQQEKVQKLWRQPAVWAVAASIALLLVAGIILINRDTLFDDPETDMVALQSFQVPVTPVGGNAMGYAGGDVLLDSIVVQIILDNLYSFHYRFQDTLHIFSSTISQDDQIMLEHHEQKDTYTLVVNDKRYPVERGFNRIQELKEE